MQVPRSRDLRLLKFARAMRRDSTDAEAKLWRILRFKSLAGYRFRRQHRVGEYILDFYCAACRLAVELDGGQHADAPQARRDQKRTRWLNKAGVRVVRFWDNDVLKHPNPVAEEILRQLESLRPPPRPSPGVPGEGVG